MKKCINSFPYLLITLGIIFLLNNFGIVEDAFSKLWPILLIVFGLTKLAESF